MSVAMRSSCVDFNSQAVSLIETVSSRSPALSPRGGSTPLGHHEYWVLVLSGYSISIIRMRHVGAWAERLRLTCSARALALRLIMAVSLKHIKRAPCCRSSSHPVAARDLDRSETGTPDSAALAQPPIRASPPPPEGRSCVRTWMGLGWKVGERAGARA